MHFAIKWEGFSVRFAKKLVDAWAEYKDFPEWFASGFSGKVQGCNGNEAGGVIRAKHTQSITTGENYFSVRFSYDGTPENLIDLLFRFVLYSQRSVKRKDEGVIKARLRYPHSLDDKFERE
jgi:hypothetical protein